MKSDDTDILNKAYDFIAGDFYGETLEPDPKGFQELVSEVNMQKPIARSATIEKVFDLTIARKLKREDFFKAVFNK